MTKIEQRYNIAHYNKRIKQNRIIESYMENNLNVTLNQLMENHDSHLILNRSKYKPKK